MEVIQTDSQVVRSKGGRSSEIVFTRERRPTKKEYVSNQNIKLTTQTEDDLTFTVHQSRYGIGELYRQKLEIVLQRPWTLRKLSIKNLSTSVLVIQSTCLKFIVINTDLPSISPFYQSFEESFSISINLMCSFDHKPFRRSFQRCSCFFLHVHNNTILPHLYLYRST